jgi:hypothetical protein
MSSVSAEFRQRSITNPLYVCVGSGTGDADSCRPAQRPMPGNHCCNQLNLKGHQPATVAVPPEKRGGEVSGGEAMGEAKRACRRPGPSGTTSRVSLGEGT